MKKALKRKRERLEEPGDETGVPEKSWARPEAYGARASTAKVCATCGHSYIKPCTTPAMLAKCANAMFLASQPKERARAKTSKA